MFYKYFIDHTGNDWLYVRLQGWCLAIAGEVFPKQYSPKRVCVVLDVTFNLRFFVMLIWTKIILRFISNDGKPVSFLIRNDLLFRTHLGEVIYDSINKLIRVMLVFNHVI